MLQPQGSGQAANRPGSGVERETDCVAPGGSRGLLPHTVAGEGNSRERGQTSAWGTRELLDKRTEKRLEN